MQFHVPQFIDVEDKLFGPLSSRQFFYLGGAAGAYAIAYVFTQSFFLAILLSAPLVSFGVALAFYKINSRPFIEVVEAAFKYITGSRLYIWKKTPKKITPGSTEKEGDLELDLFVPKLSDSKLKDLAWSLDIQESIYSDQQQR